MVELNIKALPVKDLQFLSSLIEVNVKIYKNSLKFTIAEQIMLVSKFWFAKFDLDI
jgi:hypothetical protein